MAIQANWTNVITPEGAMPAWWARPEAPRAAVLVLPEVFGVNGWVRSVADRLAEQGYAALAISTFWRTAPRLEAGYDEAGLVLGRQHRDQVRAEQLRADVMAAAAWMQQSHSADGLGEKPLGCVGFCFGGHLAMLAATLPVIAASCDFYGGSRVHRSPRRRCAHARRCAADSRQAVVLLRRSGSAHAPGRAQRDRAGSGGRTRQPTPFCAGPWRRPRLHVRSPRRLQRRGLSRRLGGDARAVW